MSSPSTPPAPSTRKSSSDTVRPSVDDAVTPPRSPFDPNQPNSTGEHDQSTPQQAPATPTDNPTTVHVAQADHPAESTSNAEPDQPTVVVVSTSIQPLPSASTTTEAPTDENKLREKPEDKGSVNTIATNTHTRTSRKQGNKTPEGPSASTSTNIHSTSTNGKAKVHSGPSKPSFFLRFVRRLIPCVPSTPTARNFELDRTAVREKEKLPSSEAPNDVPVTSDKAPEAPPRTSTGTDPASLPPLTIPPSPEEDNDKSVVASSTPTLLPKSETEGVTSGAVQAPGSTGDSVHGPHPHPRGPDTGHAHQRDLSVDGDESDETSFTEEDEVEESTPVEQEEEEDRLIMNGGAGIPVGPDGIPRPLLPPIAPHHVGRKCLVLDLDETLVHSSFKSIQSADYVVPVEIEFHWHNVYVIKRPGVDNFLKKMGEIYEVVVFTASLSKYADPVLDKLDVHQVVSHRLFRESCYNHKGNYVKDLSQLGRPIADTIILDNSPASYIFHPNNAVPVSSWFNDPHDTELTDLVPFLADLSSADDVRGVLDGGL